MRSHIKAIVFDFDNTLVVTNKFVLEHMQRTCRRTGALLPSEDILRSTLKLNLKFEEIFARLFADNATSVLQEYRSDAQSFLYKPTKGGVERINELYKQGIKLFIVTNRVRITEQRLTEAGYLKDWFEDIQSSPEGKSKPSKEAYSLALDQIYGSGIKPEEVLVVGDSLDDFLATPKKDSGKELHFIAVTSGSVTKDEFRKVGVKDLDIFPTVSEIQLPDQYNLEGKVFSI